MNPWQLAAKGTESGEQKALFCWSSMVQQFGFRVANSEAAYVPANDAFRKANPYPIAELRWLFAIPNGGARDPVTAARMKAEGLKSGVADVFLPVQRATFGGLWIELKKLKGGRVDPEQKAFAADMTNAGYAHVFALGWQEAAQAIERYLLLPPAYVANA